MVDLLNQSDRNLATHVAARHYTYMTDDSAESVEALTERLDAAYRQFNETVGRPSDTWAFWRFRAKMPSQRITALFVGFCVSTFMTGAIMTFFAPTEQLGIAIVVGAVFTGGSFMIQYWAVQVASERALYESLNVARHQGAVGEIALEINDLVAKLRKLNPDFRE